MQKRYNSKEHLAIYYESTFKESCKVKLTKNTNKNNNYASIEAYEAPNWKRFSKENISIVLDIIQNDFTPQIKFAHKA